MHGFYVAALCGVGGRTSTPGSLEVRGVQVDEDLKDLTAVQQVLNAAMKQMVARNIPVFPCNGKVPLIKGWKDVGVVTGSQIDEWSLQFSSSLTTYGVPLGNASGLVGIDEDGPLAAAKLLEISGGDLPDTWLQETPSGGRHRIYRMGPGHPCKPKRFQLDGEHSEVALMGTGQFMVFAPGFTVQGEYRWNDHNNPDTRELPEIAPGWMGIQMSDGGPMPESEADQNVPSTLVTEDSNEFAERVIERLSARCHKFREARDIQMREGLPENEWYLHVRNLSRAGHPVAARQFSMTSTKHGPRSEERLNLLSEEGTGPTIRCATFGCDEDQIGHCFGGQVRHKEGAITNSPGAFVLNMEDMLPPTDAVYGPYLDVVSTTSLFDIDQDGNLLGVDKLGNPYQISNFVARPLVETIRDNGIEQTRTFSIEGVQGGRVLKPLEVISAEFTKLDWAMDGWGLQAAIRPGLNRREMLRDFVQRMAQLAEHRTIYTHLGWRKLDEKGWAYLHAGGAIGSDDVSVELGPFLTSYRLPAEVANPMESARESLLLLDLAPPKVMYPLLGAVYLAPLLESLREAGIEPEFILWLIGTTGTRKTSMSKVMLSHFGDFVYASPPGSFRDTANAIERKAFSIKDGLLLVDDFVPGITQSEKTAQSLLRAYGDHVGRGRLKSTTEFQTTYQPRSVALVTGEDFPSGHSSNARLFGVELKPGDVDLDALTRAQDGSARLAEAMARYIEFLRPQMDALPGQLKTRFRELRTGYQRSAQHGRLAESASWLTLALEMMLNYMVHCGVLDETSRSQLADDIQKVMSDIVISNDRALQEEVPTARFARTLQSLLESGKVYVINTRGTPPLYATGDHTGWEDDNFLYLNPVFTFNKVANFLAQRGESLNVGERVLWKQLDEAGLIQVEIGSDDCVQRLPKKTVSGYKGRPRLLHLRKAALEKMLDQID